MRRLGTLHTLRESPKTDAPGASELLFSESENAVAAGDDRVNERRRDAEEMIGIKPCRSDLRAEEPGIARVGSQRSACRERRFRHQKAAGDDGEEPQIGRCGG